MLVSFNIGSAIDGVDQSLSVLDVIKALYAHGFSLIELRTVVSNTETTYVIQAPFHAETSPEILGRIVFALCNVLQQDAIAFKVNDVGYLVGPKAAEWGGEFNPEFFIS